MFCLSFLGEWIWKGDPDFIYLAFLEVLCNFQEIDTEKRQVRQRFFGSHFRSPPHPIHLEIYPQIIYLRVFFGKGQAQFCFPTAQFHNQGEVIAKIGSPFSFMEMVFCKTVSKLKVLRFFQRLSSSQIVKN